MTTSLGFDQFTHRMEQVGCNFEERWRLEDELMSYFEIASAKEKQQMQALMNQFLESKFSSLEANLRSAERKKKIQQLD